MVKNKVAGLATIGVVTLTLLDLWTQGLGFINALKGLFIETQLVQENPANTGNTVSQHIQDIKASGSISITQINKLDPSEHIKKKEFIDDLNHIQQLYPSNKPLDICMSSQQPYLDSLKGKKDIVEKVSELFSSCLEQLKIQKTSGIGVLDKHKIFLDKLSSKNNKVLEYVENLEYYMGEIDNNHLAYKAWIAQGCSNNIKMIDISHYEMENIAKIKDNCVMVFTYHDEFRESMKDEVPNYQNITGNVRIGDMDRMRHAAILNKKSSALKEHEVIEYTTIINFFVKQNKFAKSEIDKSINQLKLLAENYIDVD